MIPVKITLHNFLSYLEPEPLDFSKFDLAVLSGDNGAGKSSILEALTWVVWEKTRAASSDDLIHQGTNNMWVDFIFEHDRQVYRIFRRRDRKKQSGSSLEFQVQDKNKKNLLDDKGWQNLTEGTLRATQEKIIQILKLPYEIFVNSSYLRQGKADEFTVKTPAERKVVLSEILGLGEWVVLEEKAKLKIKNLESETQVLNFQIEELKSQLAQKESVEKEYQKSAKEREEIKKVLASLDAKFKILDDKKRKNELLTERYNDLKRRYQEIKTEIDHLNSDQKENNHQLKNYDEILAQKTLIEKQFQTFKKLKEKAIKLEEKREEYLKLRRELERFLIKKEDLVEKIKNLKSIKNCPTCFRPLPEKESLQIIEHFKKEFVVNFLPQKIALEKKIEKIGFDEKELQETKQKIYELEDIEEQKRNLAVAFEAIKNFKKMNEKIEIDKKNRNEQLKKVIVAGQKIKKEMETSKGVEENWSKLDNKLADMQNQLLAIESNFGALKQALKEIENQAKKLKETDKRLAQINQEKSVFQELSLAFSKKGIPAMIIEQAIPMIEDEANLILAKASDDRLSLRFLTQRAKKTSEELIETLEIKVADEEGERDYEMYSGGEAFRINFAIRVALSKFLAARSGVHLKFLCVDEGFGTLDASGREDLVEAINAIRPDFEKIIVVTHIQEFKDLFPTQINVTKTAHGSQFELTG